MTSLSVCFRIYTSHLVIFTYCMVYRFPPPFEHEAISIHLQQLLDCQLQQLPVHVLTDAFIHSAVMANVLPRSLHEYSTCLRKTLRKTGSGYNCISRLTKRFSGYDGRSELELYELLHGATSAHYTVSVPRELEDSPTVEPKYIQCLQSVY